MKAFARLVVPALLLCPLLALGQQATPRPAPLPNWDQLTPAQRDALTAPLRDRWNNSPEDRARMLDRAQRWRTMSPDQRGHARRGMQRWDDMNPEQRAQARALFHATRSMDRDARRAFMDNWRRMTPQQKADWLKAHPAPERGDSRRP
ncbi:MAG: DUF3106 domain-containing protein [Thermomonas sp.]|uniref:DUF3106 domain-containing protein n=1 Tax=Thermomonas sp. TaxID=1971895 RepID=UPI002630C609|nr:DUF3106 domain-containing protein [Thermomonas sp.]MCC7097607.1 DUF3106 domain-containing protein [Thermomonas sp.]